MILSKSNNYIFFKNMKVAGSSFEIYLSKFCDLEDIITPLNDEEEKIREQLDYKKKQNYKKNFFELYLNLNYLKYLIKKFPFTKYLINYKSQPRLEFRKFFHHMTPKQLKKIIGNDIYNYKKIAILREPISMFLSMYNHRLDGQNYKYITFEEFINEFGKSFFDHQYEIISLNHEIIIDFFLIYEDFQNSFKYINNKLGINLNYNEFSKLNAKKIDHPKKLKKKNLSVTSINKIMNYAKEYNMIYKKAFETIKNEKY